MNIYESVRSSFKNVLANKMRTLLTMLGIIIGIGSVIIITSLGEGSRVEMNNQFESMGVGRINVSVASNSQNITKNDQLTTRDFEALAKMDNVKYISAVYNGRANIKLLDPSSVKTANLTGIYGQYEEINNPTLLYGRYITESDNDLGTKVAVINDTTAQNVFGFCGPDIIGRKIQLKTGRGTQSYTVVGVVTNPNFAAAMRYTDQFPETVYMPMVTVQRLFGAGEISQISVMVHDTDAIDDIAASLTDRLDTLHGTTEKYYAQNTMQIMDTVNTMVSMVTGFISAVAAISLVVGGIGVMNIMLVTVSERTREIGIRKSIGAKKKDIRVQFLIEATILAGIGGVFGLLLGWAGGRLAGNIVGITAVVSVSAVLAAVLVSCGIGIIFGVYPANKAAKLDPIEALRYE